MTCLTVAAAQIECVAGDVAANLALHLAMIADARGRGVDLLVFPELSLTDYVSVPDLERVGLTQTAPEFDLLAAAAGEMHIAVGFIERTNAGYHVAQALIEHGRIAHIHRKINLATYGNLQEGLHYSPGREIEVADIAGWHASTLICADAWNPAIPWLAALKGADIFLMPTASALDAVADFDNPMGWDVTLRQIALTYGCPIIMTNHCGKRDNLSFWGGSRIIDPFGTELARAGTGPELLIAELDHADITEARRRLPTIRDADAPFIAAELSGILATPAMPRTNGA